MSPTFAQSLRTAMKKRKVSNEEIAERMGVHPVTVSKLLNGKMRMTEDRMQEFAEALGMTVGEIAAAASVVERRPAGREDVRHMPVYGLAAGAVIGAHVMSEHAVEYIPTPAALATVRDAYALIVTGSSMEPRYFSGDVIYLHPHRPVRPGDHVAIQEARADGIYVSIKKFEKFTDGEIVTRQYNPAAEVKFNRKQVVAMHRVLTTNELMGV